MNSQAALAFRTFCSLFGSHRAVSEKNINSDAKLITELVAAKAFLEADWFARLSESDRRMVRMAVLSTKPFILSEKDICPLGEAGKAKGWVVYFLDKQDVRDGGYPGMEDLKANLYSQTLFGNRPLFGVDEYKKTFVVVHPREEKNFDEFFSSEGIKVRKESVDSKLAEKLLPEVDVRDKVGLDNYFSFPTEEKAAQFAASLPTTIEVEVRSNVVGFRGISDEDLNKRAINAGGQTSDYLEFEGTVAKVEQCGAIFEFPARVCASKGAADAKTLASGKPAFHVTEFESQYEAFVNSLSNLFESHEENQVIEALNKAVWPSDLFILIEQEAEKLKLESKSQFLGFARFVGAHFPSTCKAIPADQLTGELGEALKEATTIRPFDGLKKFTEFYFGEYDDEMDYAANDFMGREVEPEYGEQDEEPEEEPDEEPDEEPEQEQNVEVGSDYFEMGRSAFVPPYDEQDEEPEDEKPFMEPDEEECYGYESTIALAKENPRKVQATFIRDSIIGRNKDFWEKVNQVTGWKGDSIIKALNVFNLKSLLREMKALKSKINLNAPHCPKCDYRAVDERHEIVERDTCPSCGLDLVPGSIEEAVSHRVSKGLMNAFGKVGKPRRVCASCGFGMPSYPGRYPSMCPHCGRTIQEAIKSSESKPFSEVLTELSNLKKQGKAKTTSDKNMVTEDDIAESQGTAAIIQDIANAISEMIGQEVIVEIDTIGGGICKGYVEPTAALDIFAEALAHLPGAFPEDYQIEKNESTFMIEGLPRWFGSDIEGEQVEGTFNLGEDSLFEPKVKQPKDEENPASRAAKAAKEVKSKDEPDKEAPKPKEVGRDATGGRAVKEVPTPATGGPGTSGNDNYARVQPGMKGSLFTTVGKGKEYTQADQGNGGKSPSPTPLQGGPEIKTFENKCPSCEASLTEILSNKLEEIQEVAFQQFSKLLPPEWKIRERKGVEVSVETDNGRRVSSQSVINARNLAKVLGVSVDTSRQSDGDVVFALEALVESKLVEQDPVQGGGQQPEPQAGVSVEAPPEGEPTKSQSEPAEEPEKPTEMEPTQKVADQEKGGVGVLQCPSCQEEIPKDVLKGMLGALLQQIATQMQQGATTPEPGEEEPGEEEEEEPKPQEAPKTDQSREEPKASPVPSAVPTPPPPAAAPPAPAKPRESVDEAKLARVWLPDAAKFIMVDRTDPSVVAILRTLSKSQDTYVAGRIPDQKALRAKAVSESIDEAVGVIPMTSMWLNSDDLRDNLRLYDAISLRAWLEAVVGRANIMEVEPGSARTMVTVRGRRAAENMFKALKKARIPVQEKVDTKESAIASGELAAELQIEGHKIPAGVEVKVLSIDEKEAKIDLGGRIVGIHPERVAVYPEGAVLADSLAALERGVSLDKVASQRLRGKSEAKRACVLETSVSSNGKKIEVYFPVLTTYNQAKNTLSELKNAVWNDEKRVLLVKEENQEKQRQIKGMVEELGGVAITTNVIEQLDTDVQGEDASTVHQLFQDAVEKIKMARRTLVDVQTGDMARAVAFLKAMGAKAGVISGIEKAATAVEDQTTSITDLMTALDKAHDTFMKAYPKSGEVAPEEVPVEEPPLEEPVPEEPPPPEAPIPVEEPPPAPVPVPATAEDVLIGKLRRSNQWESVKNLIVSGDYDTFKEMALVLSEDKDLRVVHETFSYFQDEQVDLGSVIEAGVVNGAAFQVKRNFNLKGVVYDSAMTMENGPALIGGQTVRVKRIFRGDGGKVMVAIEQPMEAVVFAPDFIQAMESGYILPE